MQILVMYSCLSHTRTSFCGHYQSSSWATWGKWLHYFTIRHCSSSKKLFSRAHSVHHAWLPFSAVPKKLNPVSESETFATTEKSNECITGAGVLHRLSNGSILGQRQSLSGSWSGELTLTGGVSSSVFAGGYSVLVSAQILRACLLGSTSDCRFLGASSPWANYEASLDLKLIWKWV